MHDSPVTTDDDMHGRHAQIEHLGQCAVINDYRHIQPVLLAVAADGRRIIAEPGIHCDHLDLLAVFPVNLAQTRHLLPARNAPGRPEFQVNRLVAVALLQVDCLAVDGVEDYLRRSLADQRCSRAPGSPFAIRVLLGGDAFRLRRRIFCQYRGGAQNDRQAEEQRSDGRQHALSIHLTSAAPAIRPAWPAAEEFLAAARKS